MARKYLEIFKPDTFYHIYNKAVGKDKLFYNDSNREYFLKLLSDRLSPFMDFYAYALLPNHYHLLVKTTDIADIPYDTIISELFRIIGIKFTKSINNQEGRKGTLFTRPFKRIHVNSEEYLKDLIMYIHLNPFYHNVDPDFENYKWSSFSSNIKKSPTRIKRDEVIYFFNDVENFLLCHKQKQEFSIIESMTIEKFEDDI